MYNKFMVMVPETPVPKTLTKEAPGPRARPLTKPLENIGPAEMTLLKQTAHTILTTLTGTFANPTLAADIKTLTPRVEQTQKQGKIWTYPVEERRPISQTTWPEVKSAAARMTTYAAESKPKMELLRYALIQEAQGFNIPRTPDGGFDLETLRKQLPNQEIPPISDDDPQASSSSPEGIERLVAHTIDKFILPDLDPIEEFGRTISKGPGYAPILDLSLDYVYSGTKAVQNNLGLIRRALQLVLDGQQIPQEGYHGVIDIPAMKKIQANDRLFEQNTPPLAELPLQPLPALVSTY